MKHEYNLSYIFIISLIVALGGLLFGFDLAIVSGTIPFITKYFTLDASSLGFAVGILNIGCIVGVLFAGWLTDHFGRKKILIVSAIFFTLSAIGTALAESYNVFIMFRFMAGIAVGSASILSPMYIAEICPAKFRGRMVAFNQLTIVIGSLLAYYSSYILSDYSLNWRLMYASAGLPALLFFIGLFFIPESPRWLAKKGLFDKSLSILCKTGNDVYAQNELNSIRKSLTENKSGKVRDLLKPGIKLIMIMGIFIAIFQQFTGANNIYLYAPVIFAKAGLGINAALFQNVIIGLVGLIFTIISIWLIDYVGRKILALVGSISMAVCMTLIAGSFYFNMLEGIHLTVFILMFVASFALSWGPVTWVLISEIFPNYIRGIGMSVAACFLWLSTFMVSFAFPIFVKHLDIPATFMIYAVFNLLAFVYVLKNVPETMGKSLEQLEIDLNELPRRKRMENQTKNKKDTPQGTGNVPKRDEKIVIKNT